eukprot:gene15073-6239_t
MANYFSSSDSDEEPFYGFLDEELNFELVERRRGVDVEEESDIDIDGSSADSLGLSDTEDSERGEPDEEIITEEGNWTKNLKDFDNFVEFTSPVGPTKSLGEDASEIDFFELLFPKELYAHISTETNKYALHKRHPPLVPDNDWYPTTVEEIKLYLGIRVYMSILNFPSFAQYWSKDSVFGNSFISNLMSRNRFQKINEYFHVADRTTMPPKSSPHFDKLFLVRPVLDAVRKNCLKAYNPHKCFAIDEAMIKFRGRSSLKQHLPAKPTKYGIKVWMRADSLNGFCNEFFVYTGKPTGKEPEKNLGQKVVKQLTENIENKGHHGYTDNYFTTVAGVEERFEKGVYLCGTIKSNAKGLPQEIKGKKICKEAGSYIQFQKGGSALSAVAWREKKSRKPVRILSANVNPSAEISSVARKQRDGTRVPVMCPIQVSNYNKFMNAVDRNDQIRTQYMTYRRCNRWWTYIFWFLFDLSVANSFLLFKESPNHKTKNKSGKDEGKTQLKFRMALTKQLIGQKISRKRKRGSASLGGEVAATGHWPKFLKDKKGRCRNCHKKGIRREPRYICGACTALAKNNERIHLCPECFEEYHTMTMPNI